MASLHAWTPNTFDPKYKECRSTTFGSHLTAMYSQVIDRSQILSNYTVEQSYRDKTTRTAFANTFYCLSNLAGATRVAVACRCGGCSKRGTGNRYSDVHGILATNTTFSGTVRLSDPVDAAQHSHADSENNILARDAASHLSSSPRGASHRVQRVSCGGPALPCIRRRHAGSC